MTRDRGCISESFTIDRPNVIVLEWMTVGVREDSSWVRAL